MRTRSDFSNIHEARFQGRVKDVMRERLKLLATGDWSSLTLGSLQLKAPLQNLEISEADVEK